MKVCWLSTRMENASRTKSFAPLLFAQPLLARQQALNAQQLPFRRQLWPSCFSFQEASCGFSNNSVGMTFGIAPESKNTRIAVSYICESTSFSLLSLAICPQTGSADTSFAMSPVATTFFGACRPKSFLATVAAFFTSPRRICRIYAGFWLSNSKHYIVLLYPSRYGICYYLPTAMAFATVCLLPARFSLSELLPRSLGWHKR